MYAVMTIPQRMVMAHLKKLLTRKSLSSYAQESLAMLQMFMLLRRKLRKNLAGRQNTGVEEMCREQCSWVDHSNYGELVFHDFDFDLIGGIIGLFATHPHSDLLPSAWKSLSLSLSAKHFKIQTSLSKIK
ncbi:hypothetical protein NC651_001105 [Populus alba x Populus x berolinensis]|nr:hypothetical protein NC651_001105 [Populus alba x Populus x berolinensis]